MENLDRPGFANAVYSLRPNASWAVRDGNLEWYDTEYTEPTAEEIATELTRLQTEFDNRQYRRDRVGVYPSIEEQLDMQYWDSVNGTTTWVDAIAAVKGAHPKPE